MSNKWASKMANFEGYADPEKKVSETHIRSPSPSINWAFGNKGHGIPLGSSLLLGGEAKAGKSFIALNMVAQLHKDDPEAIAVMFNTEYRGEIQANKKSLQKLGIDPARFFVYDTNMPDQIFDRISTDYDALCQEGMPLKLIIIDSMSQIMGRRTLNADSIMTQQIGDDAATVQVGLKQILPTIRKHRISMILCTHVRAEMDPHEVMRGNKFRLQGANALKHFAEFFAYVERNRSKEGRKTIDGVEFKDEGVTDLMGKSEVTGHKIRFKMLDSSTGQRDRTAEFTLDFERGIINQHEEIFRLGLNTGVILKPNQTTYQFGDKSWRGLANAVAGVKEDPSLQQAILDQVYAQDKE